MVKGSRTATSPVSKGVKNIRNKSPKAEKKVVETPVDTTEVQPEEQTSVRKNLIKKDPAVIRLDDGFSAGAIINVLKSYYREHPVIDGHRKRTVNIHLADDKSEHNVIDLMDYTGFFSFIDTYIKHHQIPLAERNSAEIPVAFSMAEVIDSVFDMRLRGALHIADTYKGLSGTREMQEVMTSQVLPVLGFERDAATDLQGYIKALHEFISNDERIKTKIYNTVFPHTVHRSGDLPKGVNVIYLRNMCKFDEIVLQYVIENDLVPVDLCKLVQKEFVNRLKEMKGIPAAVLKDSVLQCVNPKIIENIINPPTVVNSKGNTVEDARWVEKLGALEIKNGKPVSTDKAVSAEVIPIIRDLVKELTTSLNVARTVKDAMQNPVKLVIEGEGKDRTETSEADEREFATCLEEYKKIWEDFVDFRKEILKVKVPAKEEAKFKLVMNQFVRIARKLAEHKCYTNAMVQLVNDVKRNDLGFNFGKDLRAHLTALVEGEGEFTDADAEKFVSQFKYFTSSKAHDPFELDVYSRIGRLCGMMLKKEYKILIGVAIMSFVQEQIKRIALADTKKDLNIYIKTDAAHAAVLELLKDVAVKREIKKKDA